MFDYCWHRIFYYLYYNSLEKDLTIGMNKKMNLKEINNFMVKLMLKYDNFDDGIYKIHDIFVKLSRKELHEILMLPP